MSLTIIEPLENCPDIRHVWKVFRVGENSYLFPRFSGTDEHHKNDDRPLARGIWMNEADFRPSLAGEIITPSYETYPQGWHSYIHREQAEWALDAHFDSLFDVILMPAEVREPIAYGFEYSSNYGVSRAVEIIVTRFLRIPLYIEGIKSGKLTNVIKQSLS